MYRSRNQIVLVLVLDCPISDYENEDDEEDERFARPATIWTDTAGNLSDEFGCLEVVKTPA